MLALRNKQNESAAQSRSDRTTLSLGVVRCPKCTTKIEILAGGLTPAEEFSVRCTTCHSRSFHLRSEITSAIASKANG